MTSFREVVVVIRREGVDKRAVQWHGGGGRGRQGRNLLGAAEQAFFVVRGSRRALGGAFLHLREILDGLFGLHVVPFLLPYPLDVVGNLHNHHCNDSQSLELNVNHQNTGEEMGEPEGRSRWQIEGNDQYESRLLDERIVFSVTFLLLVMSIMVLCASVTFLSFLSFVCCAILLFGLFWRSRFLVCSFSCLLGPFRLWFSLLSGSVHRRLGDFRFSLSFHFVLAMCLPASCAQLQFPPFFHKHFSKNL